MRKSNLLVKCGFFIISVVLRVSVIIPFKFSVIIIYNTSNANENL